MTAESRRWRLLRGVRAHTPSERPWRFVPRGALWALVLVLAVQAGSSAVLAPPAATASALAAAPPLPVARLAALGEPVALARLLNLWLQAHDNQPGINIPYASLDYSRVRDWLQLTLDLDPRGQYPLLAATRLYASVPVANDRRRLMLDFVARSVPGDPGARWRWLADAALIAKYKLEDLPLALRYAEIVSAQAGHVDLPFWARDLRVLVLADMCEVDAVKVLVGGLAEGGALVDAAERRFLARLLAQLESGECEPGVPRAPGRIPK
ncbi:MAG: hypothetical protein AAF458_15895 [Pseudomonadota bacterium]